MSGSKSLGTVLRNVPAVQEKALTFKSSKSYKTSPINLPLNFDGRVAWKGWLQKVFDQEACGICYAFSTASMLGDRFAILSLGKVLFEASPAELGVCGHDFDANVANEWKNPAYLKQSQTDFLKNRSCNGSSLYDVLETLYREGLTTTDCFPLKSSSNPAYNVPGTQDSTKLPLCSVFESDDFDQCPVGNKAMRKYRALTVYNVDDNEQSIMYEIYKYGPVSTGFLVFPDFMTTYNGKTIYTGPPAGQDSIGGHAILLVGFGQEVQNGRLVKYWLCKNSWGPEWGDGGYFKIERNLKACQLEQNVVACLPDIPGLQIIDPRIVPVETALDLQIREFTGHFLDPVTGYYTSAIAKIKSGQLQGDLSPIFNPSNVLPDMNVFIAGDWQNTTVAKGAAALSGQSNSVTPSQNGDNTVASLPVTNRVAIAQSTSTWQGLQNYVMYIIAAIVGFTVMVLVIVALRSQK